MENNNFSELYNESVVELKKLIKLTNKRPSEKVWNKYAMERGYLLSGTIGYIYGKKFNKICREFIKKDVK